MCGISQLFSSLFYLELDLIDDKKQKILQEFNYSAGFICAFLMKILAEATTSSTGKKVLLKSQLVQMTIPRP
jgi:hypothetical protein